MKLIKLYAIDFFSDAEPILEADKLLVQGLDILQTRNPWLYEIAELFTHVKHLCLELNSKHGKQYTFRLGRSTIKVLSLVAGREHEMGVLEINFRQSLDIPIGSYLWDLDRPLANPWGTDRAYCEAQMAGLDRHTVRRQAVAPVSVPPAPRKPVLLPPVAPLPPPPPGPLAPPVPPPDRGVKLNRQETQQFITLLATEKRTLARQGLIPTWRDPWPAGYDLEALKSRARAQVLAGRTPLPDDGPNYQADEPGARRRRPRVLRAVIS